MSSRQSIVDNTRKKKNNIHERMGASVIIDASHNSYNTSDENESYQNLPVPFASIFAQEIRNPLTNILLSVEILAPDLKSEEQKLYLDVISRNADKINHLIAEFLKYQISDESNAENISVRQLIDEIIELLQDRITSKNILVRKVYDKKDYRMKLNKSKMKIALANIIINAIESMTLDAGQLTLGVHSKNGKCLIQIEDNGCGINKVNLKNIFNPYYSNKAGGLGGLVSTYEILRKNHIKVNVESSLGKGTRFDLLFDEQI